LGKQGQDKEVAFEKLVCQKGIKHGIETFKAKIFNKNKMII